MSERGKLKKRSIVLLLLVLVSVITFLDRLAIAVAGPRMQDDLGISPERWGWVLGAFVLTYGLFEVPTGAFGDRFGYRKVLTRIVVWWSVFTALTGSVSGFLPLLITRLLFGVGEAGAYPNIAGVIARWFPPGERARSQGFIWGASRAGGALAPLIVLPVQEAFGWRASFRILGVMGLVWATVWYWWYRDEPAAQPGITESELQEIGTKPGGHHGGVIPWRLLLRSRQIWLIIGMYSCYAWGSWFYFSWLHTYLVKGRGFSEKEMGIFASLPFILGTVANVGGGFLGDYLSRRFGLRTGRRLVGSVSLTVAALFLIATALTAQNRLAVLYLSLGFGVMDLMLPTAWAICLDLAPKYAGAVTGAMNMSGQFGGFLCTVLFGSVVERSRSYHTPLFLIALMLLISAFLFSRIDPTHTLDEETLGVGSVGVDEEAVSAG
jgi:ACS family glucarate transporter-like MFS transporter